MTALLVFITVLALFIISVTIILFFIGPVILLQPRRRRAEFYRSLGQPVSPAELDLPYEEITVMAEPNIPLSVWFIPAPGPVRGTILYLHGVGDCKIDGLRISHMLHHSGYHVLLPDARRHGESGGTYCTYGYYEKFDVMKLIDMICSRTDITTGKIGVFGTSMGAAVALQSAAIDERIAAVIAENSFATLRSIFDDYQKRMIKVPFHYLRNLVIRRSESIAHFKASDVSPLQAVEEMKTPLLIVYGDMDLHIAHRYSLMLYRAASGPKELYAIEGAAHNNTWHLAGAAYEHTLLSFFGTHCS